MELSKSDIKATKGLAILFMLFLHLFCRTDINGLYNVSLTINGKPFIYYLALFCDACVPIYLFCSGYGLYSSNSKQSLNFTKNLIRIMKLMVNYWIILIIFISIGFIAGKGELFPGSAGKFLSNFFLFSSSYCGAWWFLQTYVILAFLSPIIIKLVNKYRCTLLISISLVVYLLSYIQHIKHALYFGDNKIIILAINAVILVGSSQLSFIVGCIAVKHKIYSRLYEKAHNLKLKNIFCLIGILLLIVIHSLYESMIIAPFTGIVFMFIFNLMNKTSSVQKTLNYFGEHSTNIWLTHMFFYMIIFPKLVFAPKYPILIFPWLIILCLVSSYLINVIYKPILHFINKKVVF